jgi:hypothetical protein
VSSKVFAHFYQSYVKTAEVEWREDPLIIYQEYALGQKADEGFHLGVHNGEEFQVNLKWCSC